MAKKIKKIFAVIALLLVLLSTGQHQVSAVSCTYGTDGCICSSQGCDDGKVATCDNSVNNTCLQQNPLVKDIQQGVNFLSAGVGVVVVGAIILGGIQYTTAGGAPEAVTKAKQRITNALIALVAFIFTWAFLNWLIPGGIFG